MFKSLHHPYYRAALIFAAIILLAFGGYWLQHHVSAIESWIQGMGPWASVGFILLFTLLTPFFVSVDLLCIVAGTLFNLPLAIFNVLVGTMIAAAVIFFVGRNFVRQPIQRILEKHPKLVEVDQLIGHGGLRILFLIRLLPLPFAFTSYAFTVSRVKFLDYWLATTGIFLYNSAITYFGSIAGHLSKQMTQGDHYTGPSNSLLFFGVIFSVLILFLIARVAKSEIDRINKPDG